MYGPGHVPPPPPRALPASVVVLRVLFAVLPLLSIGFLTWATMLRLAVVTRRTLDWILCGVSVAVMITGGVLLPENVETTQADIAVGLIILNAIAFTAYFLVADIRHDKVRLGPPAGAAPYPPYATTVPRHQAGYGYPPAYPQPQSQPLSQPQPQPQPQPQTPPPLEVPPQAGHRIDQVRAELDELSHLLRKDEGK
ncbi:hypothetical protein [Streptomyces sp. NPDC006551]|uniref:hypothetical protein n=1 Tax=Streptomyces sp. NPDC006551 TaxID=3157178 RepID=UPI0033BAB665